MIMYCINHYVLPCTAMYWTVYANIVCIVDYVLGLVDEVVRVCGCVLWTTYLAWLMKWYLCVAVYCGLRTWPG